MQVDNQKITVPVRVKVWIDDKVVMEADLETALDFCVDSGSVSAADPVMHGLMTDMPTFLRALADEIEKQPANS